MIPHRQACFTPAPSDVRRMEPTLYADRRLSNMTVNSRCAGSIVAGLAFPVSLCIFLSTGDLQIGHKISALDGAGKRKRQVVERHS